MFFDPLYLLIIAPGMLLALWAQLKVKTAFAHYSRIPIARHLTGAQAASLVLEANGIYDVAIEEVSGWLSDHYDPTSKTLRLSPDVYTGHSIAAVGIAAHEAGHAIQHARGYAALALRSAMVPIAQYGSFLPWILLAFGIMLKALALVWLGIILFAGATAFTLVTLPVEFNASSRARVALADLGITVSPEEQAGVQAVLSAAAWTYVAAAVTAVLQLLYFLLRAGLLGSDE